MPAQTSTDSSRDVGIAEEIMRQLGGGRFMLMTGAKKPIAVDNGLRVQIPRGKIVDIILNGKDLYDIKVIRVTMPKINSQTGAMSLGKTTVLGERQDVHVEELHETFTSLTGLHTRF